MVLHLDFNKPLKHINIEYWKKIKVRNRKNYVDA